MVRKMTEQEYLNSKGVGSSLSGFMDDKIRSNKYVTSQNGRARQTKQLNSFQDRYYSKRSQARREYSRLVKAGKIKAPSNREHLVTVAQGNPENASVRAARRFLTRHGISWTGGGSKKGSSGHSGG